MTMKRSHQGLINQMTNKTIGEYLVFVALVGLISIVPWPDIVFSGKVNYFVDRGVYIRKILLNDSLFSYYRFDSISTYLTNEITWEYLVRYIQDGTFPFYYETFFQIISTMCVTLGALIIFRKSGWLPVLLMTNPIIFDLAYSQLRSALAICFLYIVHLLRIRSNVLLAALCLFAATIHTTMLIFFSAYWVCIILSERKGYFPNWTDKMRLLSILALGVSIGLAIGPLREFLLILIGDRRVDYQNLSSSILYLSFWAILLVLFLYDYKRTMKSIEGRYAVFVLTVVTVNIFTAGYSMRFLALTYPFLVVAIFGSSLWIRLLILPAMTMYILVQWLYFFSFVAV